MSKYLAVVLALVSGATAQMSPEEATVRAAYAKLAYAAKLGVLSRYAQTARTALPNALHTEADVQVAMTHDVPLFQFQSVRVGNTGEISQTRWDTFATKPQFDLINISMDNMPYRIKSSRGESFTQMNYVTATWGKYDNYKGDWSMPAKDIFDELAAPDKTGNRPGVAYSRFAAYTVTVALEGHQRTYQAIFLFGRRPNGAEAVWPIDHVLGMGSLNFVMEHSIYPQPLLETHLRYWPAISAWIASAGIPSTPLLRDVVCDGVSGRCGIPDRVLEQALNIRIDPETIRISLVTAHPTNGGDDANGPATPQAMVTQSSYPGPHQIRAMPF